MRLRQCVVMLLSVSALGCDSNGPASPETEEITAPAPGMFNGRLTGAVNQTISGWAKVGAYPGTNLPRILYIADPERKIKVEVIQRQEGFNQRVYDLDIRNPYQTKELDVRVLLEENGRKFFESRGKLTIEEVTSTGNVKGLLSMGLDEEPLVMGEIDMTVEVRFDAEYVGDATPFPIFDLLPSAQ